MDRRWLERAGLPETVDEPRRLADDEESSLDVIRRQLDREFPHSSPWTSPESTARPGTGVRQVRHGAQGHTRRAAAGSRARFLIATLGLAVCAVGGAAATRAVVRQLENFEPPDIRNDVAARQARDTARPTHTARSPGPLPSSTVVPPAPARPDAAGASSAQPARSPGPPPSSTAVQPAPAPRPDDAGASSARPSARASPGDGVKALPPRSEPPRLRTAGNPALLPPRPAKTTRPTSAATSEGRPRPASAAPASSAKRLAAAPPTAEKPGRPTHRAQAAPSSASAPRDLVGAPIDYYYGGRYFRFADGAWLAAGRLEGPWERVDPAEVPGPVLTLRAQ
jgi:hypothetical protein